MRSNPRTARRILPGLLVGLALLATGCRREPAGSTRTIQVSAASDLSLAFDDVGNAFRARTGITPVFTFGSTGLLAKQIENGAKVDVYAAANESFVADVVASKRCLGDTVARYARGRLVAWTRSNGIAPPKDLADLADPRFRRIAIANPDHAPYGKAAQQALEKVGAWAAVEPRLVLGENVLQTMQYVQTGNADVAIVALSLTTVVGDGVAVSIPEDLHAPIEQAMVVCEGGGNVAGGRAFVEFVASPAGRAIMTRYGFLLPGERAGDRPAVRPATP